MPKITPYVVINIRAFISIVASITVFTVVLAVVIFSAKLIESEMEGY